MKYKLTDKYSRTHGGCHWGPGITHTAEGKVLEPTDSHCESLNAIMAGMGK